MRLSRIDYCDIVAEEKRTPFCLGPHAESFFIPRVPKRWVAFLTC